MDLSKARTVFLQAIESRAQGDPRRVPTSEIDHVLLGDHLTFRYVLINALLAKATDPSVHMRSLQAGANLPGAYDARSLCHKVVVPIEKEKLQGRIGNSNEPFLNKPVRMPEVKLSNPVRGGKDKAALEALFSVLSQLNDKKEAVVHEALRHAVFTIFKRDPATTGSTVNCAGIQDTIQAETVFRKFVASSFEGESSVACTAAILAAISPSAEIVAHPANQAGSSSKGIGDIDLTFADGEIHVVEVKDKIHNESDVLQAVRRASESACPVVLFVYGPKAVESKYNRAELIRQAFDEQGTILRFSDIHTLISLAVSVLSKTQLVEALENVDAFLQRMRAKDETKREYKRLAEAGCAYTASPKKDV